MYSKTSKRRQLIQRIIVYVIMTLSVFTLVLILTMFMLGYRFDIGKGNLEQVAFLQFSSVPSGATVSIDGYVIGSKTPNKTSVDQGKHKIVMWRDGYDTWTKSVDVKPGTLTWLNYAILVPKDLKVETVAKYKTLASSLASPKGNFILLQQTLAKPTFELADIGPDTPTIKTLNMPASVYTAAGTDHAFMIEKWDEDGRYVIINHRFGAKTEWLLLDTQDINASKNITRLFDVTIDQIVFDGTNGNSFYALTSGNIRRLELSAGTISKPVVSGVNSFDFYNESKVITWVRNAKDGQNERGVGVYREGDENPSTITTFSSDPSVPIRITTTHYFNEDYVAVSEGSKVTVSKGSYPNTTSDNSSSMKSITTFNTPGNVDELMFSPSGEFVFARSGANYSTYDLEYQKLYNVTVEGSLPSFSMKWLDRNYIWTDQDGKLGIREFDGMNSHTINNVVTGQTATLTNNDRYLYSIGTAVDGISLQRVRMILP